MTAHREKKRAGKFPLLAVAVGCGSLFYYAGCLLVSGADTSGLWVWPLFSLLCFSAAFFVKKAPADSLWRLAGCIAGKLTALLFLIFFLFEAGVIWGMTQTLPETAEKSLDKNSTHILFTKNIPPEDIKR